MKLIHAHIDNFGKLQDYDLDFTDGLNKVVYDNGWGKSTLVAFIRVMLYGFENERKRSEVENERKRFEPWQGGTYGGSLVFEQDGKEYRIERVFDKGNDSFNLYDNETDLPVDDYSENVGVELFGIDRESFSRTVFVGQQDCATEATSQINSKIGNVSTETADMAMYDKAASALHNEQNRISARRATGELSKLRSKIAERRAFISNKLSLESNYESVSGTIVECQEQIDAQERLVRECDKHLEEAATKNRLLADKRDYATKIEERNRAETTLNSIQAKFPKGAPSLEEVDTIVAMSADANGLNKVVEGTALSEDESQEYVNLQIRFRKGIPSEEELAEIEDKINQIEELRTEKQVGVLSDEDYQDFSVLEKQFSLGAPSKDSVEALLNEWRAADQVKDRLDGLKSQYDARFNSLRATAANNKEEATRKAKTQYDAENKIALLIMAAGLVVSLLGMFLYFKFKVVWLLLWLLVGIAVIAYGYFFKKPSETMIEDVDYKVKDYENDPGLLELRASMQEAEDNLRSFADERQAFLTEFGFPQNVIDDRGWFYDLGKSIEEYNKLQERVHSQNDFQETLTELTKPVFEFFDGYKIKSNLGSLSNDLFRMENMIARVTDFKEKMRRQRATRGQLEKDKLRLDAFVKKYALDAYGEVIDLTTLRDDVIALDKAQKAFEERRIAVESFKEEHDMQALQLVEDYEVTDLESYKTQKSSAQETLRNLKTAMKDCVSNEENLSERLQEIEDAEEELMALEEQEKALAWRQTIVNKTADYLEEAKNNFLKKYLAPMQNSFDQYFEMMSGEDAEVYELDARLNITKRANGKKRNVELLSEGYKDLVGLCRRMAMVDAMFEDEKPFLIFDDPFVNLDDEKLDCGLEFMKNVSRKYQVIYTTCHTSRSV